MRKVPMRTCVMCRQKTDKRELLRIVRNSENEVVFDPTGKLNGRGAYVCRNESCIEDIKKGKKINAALETNAQADELEKVVDNIKRFLK